ncbi:hypothetical protein FS749_005727 [Ceratobasidium sp. UAMH 11750]|nr:hypothetical protein FS749_005727 [Ceratobasidium sp. UAMH 11750]
MDSSDDEGDWDEVEIPQAPLEGPQPESIDIALVEAEPYPQLEHDIEITLTKAGGINKQEQEEIARQRQVAAQDRLVRLASHKFHAVALLASLSIRNQWLNDDLLKARVLSLIPLPIQHAFASITKSAHPDPARRGRLFETALSRLVDWFAPSSSFATQNPYMGRSQGWFRVKEHGHIRAHTFEAASTRVQVLEGREAERQIRRAERTERRAKRARALIKGKGKGRAVSSSSSGEDEDLEEEDEGSEWYAPETLRSTNSIAKHALQRSGSRDMATLVFVAMVRAIGLPARLVGSLQCVSWSPPKDHSDKKGKKEARNGAGTRSEQISGRGNVEMGKVAMPSPKLGFRGGSVFSNGTPPRSEQHLGDHDDASTPFRLGAKRKRSGLAEASDGDRRVSDDSKRGRNPSGLAEGSKQGGGSTSRGSPVPPAIKLRRARPTGNVLGAAPATPWEPSTGSEGVPADGSPTLWVEVFSRPDGRWLPVDPVRGIVNRARVFEEQHKPGRKGANKLVYVVAVEEDGYARDVTARYAKNFAAKTAKARARVAAGGRGGKVEWWDSVMRVLRRPYALHRNDVEDAELSHQQALEGLPSSIGAFKNHPIYALERHLRKDEAIFPRTEIAHFRGEPVFPRQNVLPLKPADGWMRQGRVLRAGMQPIKQSIARASTVRKKRELEMRREEEGREVTVGMYAHWQTELYTPPPVVDGRIPTNDFGNIDLYVPTMLPAGAVHIPQKGCAKIARKLGVHFAEAVTGFEFRKRQATPIITGIVIAAENEQVFLEALASHTRTEELRAAAKRRERVLQRWSRLVQGLRIVRRLNEQYSNTRGEQLGDGADTNLDGVESEGPGGFLDDLRDVVKPYNLPEAQHLVPRLTTSGDDADTVPMTGAVMSEFLLVPDAYDSPNGNMSNGQSEENFEPEDILDQTRERTEYPGPPLTMQQLANQQSKAQTKADSEEPSLDNNDEPSTSPVQPASRQKANAKRSRVTRNTAQRGGGTTQDAARDGVESDRDDSEYIEGVGSARAARPSRRKRHAPPTSGDSAPSTSTRTLRPRRNR